ncbi:invasin domain 3-containing protein [Tenacibaculum finnmarkense]|uniref:T9SS type B sorting domain-containing protein n=1 Tax=Tenacibaculum finnmarkense TaxID=2781243 RepID=UPI001E2B2871|nr:invasin domain 3-containing protein [Tenacibaculum finnmarkense]MCD8422592.1 gliding motility-associated C-terminal domain-containing protein [Tenacibaculum finnmarkense genomovar ulcerans]MCG8238596.1 gliding motility-associated C-terminal domain-containing protein [Tenacibaculum finnmarkense genomovar ulcerans]MCG8893614.1 T9SS type B sorting domain-containing protein [Tenacibaculum finnmarkense]
MKKIILLVLSFLATTIYAQGNQVTVGTPECGRSISKAAPARYDYVLEKENSWASMLYNASQISASGAIKGLAFYADCMTSEECTFDTAKNQKIYLKEVDFNQFNSTSEPDLSTFTKVYDGDITWKRGLIGQIENSKTQIAFDTEFKYSGKKSLVVYFSNENNTPLGGYMGCGTSPSFLWDDKAGEKSIIYENFKKGEKIASGSFGKERPVTRFYFDEMNTEDFTPSEQKATITADTKTIRANGVSSSLITVQLYNKDGSILKYANQRVTLSTTAGVLGSVMDKKDGTYTAYLTSSTEEETAVISGMLNGVMIRDTEEVKFTKNKNTGAEEAEEENETPSTDNGTKSNNLVQGFSPNNDGTNDTWQIFSNTDIATKYPNNSLFIFNRLGYQVYDAAPYKDDWNGESNGKITVSKDAKLPVGSYYFIFNTGQDKEIIKGWVQINY